MAAATENYYNSQNNDPSVVILEDMAKAVVVHYVSSKMVCGRSFSFLPAYYYVMQPRKNGEKTKLFCHLHF